MILTHHRLEIYTKKPTYMGARFLRKLPVEIKKEINENKFKIKLKDFLTELVVYSLEEFYNLNLPVN